MDGSKWTSVAQGKPASPSIDIRFNPVQARYIRITQTEAADGAPPWAIRQLRLFEPGK
jgi:hypothetical protein